VRGSRELDTRWRNLYKGEEGSCSSSSISAIEERGVYR
jgi:hypothetical protein